MQKIYMAGCGGMLGEAFNEIFRPDYELKCTDKDVNSDWLEFPAKKGQVFWLGARAGSGRDAAASAIQ